MSRLMMLTLPLIALAGCGAAPERSTAGASPRALAIEAAQAPGPHWLSRPRVRQRVTGAPEKDCAAGVGPACFALAMARPMPPGRASAQWDERARLHRKACDAGVPLGCFFAGDLVARGLAREAASPIEGLALLTQACREGVTRACGRIGIIIRDGVYPPAAPSTGGQIVSKACAAGDRDACMEVAKAEVKASLKPGGAALAPRPQQSPLTPRREAAYEALAASLNAEAAEAATATLRDLCYAGDHLSCVGFVTTCGERDLAVCGLDADVHALGTPQAVQIGSAQIPVLGGCVLSKPQRLDCGDRGSLRWVEAADVKAAEAEGRALLGRVVAQLRLMETGPDGAAAGDCTVLGEAAQCMRVDTPPGVVAPGPAQTHWATVSQGGRGIFVMCVNQVGELTAPCNQIFMAP